MTNTQFGADESRRASFRETLRGTLDCMMRDELVSSEEAATWPDRQDEALAMLLLARALETAVDLQRQLIAVGETMDLADKTLELMLREAQAKDAWIEKKGLVYPGREQKKAA